jgi:D-sedoheptulose 7-phosphate isomerase
MRSDIESSVNDAIAAVEFLKREESLDFISNASDLIAQCFEQGGKVLIAGNGGSLCDAMHFAEELTGRFREDRKALPAIALSDPGYLTCTGNDFGFEHVFSRGVEAFGNPGDVLIVLTTSGNSENLYRALLMAQKKGLKTIAFLGKTGGKMKGMADLEWIITGFSYSDRVQEAHMTASHIIIEFIEKKLFQPALNA